MPSIAETIVVEGEILSTVHVNVTGVGSLFVELSSDNTLNVCVPSPKFTEVNWIGLIQIVKLELSKLHSKWSTPPVSVPENVNVIDVDLVVPSFVTALLLPSTDEFIEVAGGVVSTVHVNVEGEGLVFPTVSWALTLRI